MSITQHLDLPSDQQVAKVEVDGHGIHDVAKGTGYVAVRVGETTYSFHGPVSALGAIATAFDNAHYLLTKAIREAR